MNRFLLRINLLQATILAFGMISAVQSGPVGIIQSGVAGSGIIRVPEDYPNIQAGIDAAVDGDTVLVADNIYFDNIRFKGKAITVASYFIIDGDTSWTAGRGHSRPARCCWYGEAGIFLRRYLMNRVATEG